MKTKLKSILAASAAVVGLALPAATVEAKSFGGNLATEPATESFGRCGVSYGRGYDYGRHHSRLRTRCRVIHTCYFTRGCHRYKKITYLHEKIDCYGRVVRCWRTYKTICVGRIYHHY